MNRAFLALGAVLGGALLLFAVAVAFSAPAPPRALFLAPLPVPLVIAHQGGDGLRPGNTLAAFENAVRLRVDMLEMDVQSSADGVLVLMHDSTVDRTTDGSGAVAGFSLAELQQLDAGYDWSTKDQIELSDSKTEYKFLRNNLLTPMVRILSENKDVEYPQKLFEIGKVFSRNSQKETGIEEKEQLILAFSPSNSTIIKQNIDYIFKKINLKYSTKENSINNFIDGRCVEIILNGKQVGYFGELHPNFLKLVGIKMPVSLAEINLEEVYKEIN